MKVYTFDYVHRYSHGGIVVIAASYEEAKKEISSNEKIGALIFDNSEDYDKNRCIIPSNIPCLEFKEEFDLNDNGIIYHYLDEC